MRYLPSGPTRSKPPTLCCHHGLLPRVLVEKSKPDLNQKPTAVDRLGLHVLHTLVPNRIGKVGRLFYANVQGSRFAILYCMVYYFCFSLVWFDMCASATHRAWCFDNLYVWFDVYASRPSPQLSRVISLFICWFLCAWTITSNSCVFYLLLLCAYMQLVRCIASWKSLHPLLRPMKSQKPGRSLYRLLSKLGDRAKVNLFFLS